MQTSPAAHAVVQVPQWAASVWVLTSQPSIEPALQSAKPVLHVAITHAPAAHALVAFGRLHTRPQAPQLVTSPARLAHPAEQQVCPTVQGGPPLHPMTVHTPLEHALPIRHAKPQPPQFALVFRAVSHPSSIVRLQSAKPTSHEIAHVPAAHVGLAFGLGTHVVPHEPQLRVSVAVFVQVVPQQVWLTEQPPRHPLGRVHSPAVQTSPPVQRFPHRPQLLGSLAKLTHAPPQQFRPGLHPMPPHRGG